MSEGHKTMTTLGEMSREELRAMIRQEIEYFIDFRQDAFEIADDEEHKSVSPDKLQQLWEQIDRDLWVPPSGTPSVVDLLREDRDA